MFRFVFLVLASVLMSGCIHFLYHPTIQTVDEDYKTKEAVFKTSIKRRLFFSGKALEEGRAFDSRRDASMKLKRMLRLESRDFCKENSNSGDFKITKKSKKKELLYYDTHTSKTTGTDGQSSHSDSSTTTTPIYNHFHLMKIQCE